ncbi:MAG: extracellular solute-binding protein [Rhodobacteraceae bacterium]|nr:extracellular solute-binding protein [Paracoccaceae bacterium]
MRLFSAWLLLLLGAASAVASSERKLTVVSWGGPYEQAQRQAILDPFTKETGIEISVLEYDGTPASIAARAEAEGWDLIDMTEFDAISACDDGLLLPLNGEEIVIPSPGIGVQEDFVKRAFRKCTVAQNVYASVIAFNVEMFPGVKPSRVEDLFNIEAFPGKRAIQRSPNDILEWVLLAEGVPPGQVYDLLSTDRGLRLAFRRLDEMREHIVWWDTVDEPARLLAERKVSMASGFNGRFFASAYQEGQPISIIWDGRLIGHEVWGIAWNSDQVEEAKQLLAYATSPERLAALSEIIPYGPTRRSAMMRVGLGGEANIPMLDHLPNSPKHGQRSLTLDSGWYANTEALRSRRFNAWLEAGQEQGAAPQQ